MAENKKILLKSSAGDNLYPRASLDNLVDVVGGTTAVQVPTLDSNGHVARQFLPVKTQCCSLIHRLWLQEIILFFIT